MGQAAFPAPTFHQPMEIIPLICSSLLLGGGAGAAARPNIILILADDLGYETIGANGGTSYQTPVLDKLAASGMRFTHCYAHLDARPARLLP